MRNPNGKHTPCEVIDTAHQGNSQWSQDLGARDSLVSALTQGDTAVKESKKRRGVVRRWRRCRSSNGSRYLEEEAVHSRGESVERSYQTGCIIF